MKTVNINTVKEIASKININFDEAAKMNVKELSVAHYRASRQSSNDFNGTKKMLVDFYSKMIGLKMVFAI